MLQLWGALGSLSSFRPDGSPGFVLVVLHDCGVETLHLALSFHLVVLDDTFVKGDNTALH